MNRRLGISILGVLSLTAGLLVAEYAFAPLREPYPADKPSSQSDAESTASPSEAAPSAPTNQSQHSSPPVERRDAAGEADGDPMVAEARPVIDAVWQSVDESAARVRVSLVSTAALAGRESAARAIPAVGASPIGPMGSGGAFLGTQRGRVSASTEKPTTPPVVDSAVAVNAPSDAAAEDLPKDAGTPPSEPMAMNDAPSSPAIDGMIDPGASLPQNMEPVARNDEPAPVVTPLDSPKDSAQDEGVQAEPMDMLDNLPPSPPLPQVSVPEPLSGSLFLFGILLGVVGRRSRRPA